MSRTINSRNFFFFLQFYCTHINSLFCTEKIQILNFFQPQHFFTHMFLPHCIFKIHYEMHVSHCLSIASSIQFHHIINIQMSYPLKFVCPGCWQITHEKNCCKRKKLFHFYRLLTHSDDLIGGSIARFFNDSGLRLESTTTETVWTVNVVLLCVQFSQKSETVFFRGLLLTVVNLIIIHFDLTSLKSIPADVLDILYIFVSSTIHC